MMFRFVLSIPKTPQKTKSSSVRVLKLVSSPVLVASLSKLKLTNDHPAPLFDHLLDPLQTLLPSPQLILIHPHVPFLLEEGTEEVRFPGSWGADEEDDFGGGGEGRGDKRGGAWLVQRAWRGSENEGSEGKEVRVCWEEGRENDREKERERNEPGFKSLGRNPSSGGRASLGRLPKYIYRTIRTWTSLASGWKERSSEREKEKHSPQACRISIPSSQPISYLHLHDPSLLQP